VWTGCIWLRTGIKWQALGNMIMNLWVPYKVGNFLVEGLIASQEGLCSM